MSPVIPCGAASWRQSHRALCPSSFRTIMLAHLGFSPDPGAWPRSLPRRGAALRQRKAIVRTRGGESSLGPARSGDGFLRPAARLIGPLLSSSFPRPRGCLLKLRSAFHCALILRHPPPARIGEWGHCGWADTTVFVETQFRRMRSSPWPICATCLPRRQIAPPLGLTPLQMTPSQKPNWSAPARRPRHFADRFVEREATDGSAPLHDVVRKFGVGVGAHAMRPFHQWNMRPCRARRGGRAACHRDRGAVSVASERRPPLLMKAGRGLGARRHTTSRCGA